MNQDIQSSVVALGCFDGVHLGHQAVLNQCKSLAKQFHLKAKVFTFAVGTILQKQGRVLSFLYGSELQTQLFQHFGMEEIYAPDFSEICMLSGEAFAEKILKNRLHASYVVCGKDFRFGKNASCGVAELKTLGEKYGFSVEIAEEVALNGDVISSTQIRKAVTEGNMRLATAYLGLPYYIYGIVQRGNQIGRTIEIPTANLVYEENQCRAKDGVYAGYAFCDGAFYDCVLNIGMNPTVNNQKRTIEIHLLHANLELYDKPLRVALLEYLREERKFENLEMLKKQIETDMQRAEEILKVALPIEI